MPYVAVIFAQNLARSAGLQLEMDGRLIADGEILFQVPVEAGTISAQAHYDILGEIVDRTRDRADLSLRYANSLDIDQLGTLGLACKAAPDVAGALQRLVRYMNLLSDSIGYHITPQNDGALLWQERLSGEGPGLILSAEAGLTAVIRLVRQISAEPIQPSALFFRHSGPPRDAQLLETYFGCPARFGSEVDGIELTEKCLATPNRVGDQALSDFLTTHLDAELAAKQTSERFADQVLHKVQMALSEGAPTATTLAAEFGLSERTFHRRLSDDGQTYRGLLEQTRKSLAQRLLREKGRPLAEIAFLTGFSEQSAFTRAFKRWQGQTPAEFRIAQAG